MDLTEYKDMFAAEAREYLQSLNRHLLDYEKDPSPPLLDEMFRAAHSLKGMSGTMGYEQLAELTHAMESVLALLKNGELGTSPEVINTLFESLDVLETTLEDTIAERPVASVSGMKQRLLSLADAEKGCPDPIHNTTPSLQLDEFEKELIKEAEAKNQHTYEVVVQLQEGCLLRSVRAYMVLQALEKMGAIIKTIPSAQELEEEKFERTFSIVLMCDNPAVDIEKAILGISEIAAVKIQSISGAEVDPCRATASKETVEKGCPETDTPIDNGIGEYGKKASRRHVEKFVRVETERLDKLIDLVGELVISRTQVVEIGKQLDDGQVSGAFAQLERVTTELHYAATKLRMVAVKQVFDRFPRMVRDLAKSFNKKVELIVEGETTELDRSIVNQIGDPLVHALRNAVDHGIEPPEVRVATGKNETGTIRLTAKHEGSHVLIEVVDDGRGIDVEAVRRKAVERGLLTAAEADRLSELEAMDLIFEPGFSTATMVTDVSGRGVGMDAVKTVVETLQGSVEVQSKAGLGTKLRIRLPLTLAIIKVLLIEVDGEVAAIPIHAIRENLRVEAGQIRTIRQAKVITLRDEVLPLIDLANQLGYREFQPLGSYRVIVTEAGDSKLGFIVDELLGQQEVVIKSLPKILGDIPGVAGATVLGNGKVALILDVSGLVSMNERK